MRNLYISHGFFPQEYFSVSADYIAKVQLPSGAIPWFPDGVLDPWDHVEAAMGLAVCGFYPQARQAYLWLAENQEQDGGFWPAYADTQPLDTTRKESHHAPYAATGLWHYFLLTRDLEFLRMMWPCVEAALDFACSLQSNHGDIAWALQANNETYPDALITGCSSIYKSLECGLLIARELGLQRPSWQLSRQQLGKALQEKPWRFDRTWPSKQHYAMDWFYPILCGVYKQTEAQQRLKSRWQNFVLPDLGCLCVSNQPWITVAESCELVMALLAAGQYSQAARVFSWLHHNRDQHGAYWTGFQRELGIYWPREKPTWTAAAVILAADALAGATSAADLFTGQTMPLREEAAHLSAAAK
ncbi:MAG: hypothetical protein ACLFPG_07140 [Desulfohalobiaceae bacterium]